jgi:hypothetical protein
VTDDLTVVADLRRQLLALPDRPARRPAPALAMAAVAAAALALGVFAVADRDADEAIAISRQGGGTEIRVLDAQADPTGLPVDIVLVLGVPGG